MRLSRHQQTAWEKPCYEATETTNPRFYWLQEVNQVRVSIGLTANCGLE